MGEKITRPSYLGILITTLMCTFSWHSKKWKNSLHVRAKRILWYQWNKKKFLAALMKTQILKQISYNWNYTLIFLCTVLSWKFFVQIPLALFQQCFFPCNFFITQKNKLYIYSWAWKSHVPFLQWRLRIISYVKDCPFFYTVIAARSQICWFEKLEKECIRMQIQVKNSICASEIHRWCILYLNWTTQKNACFKNQNEAYLVWFHIFECLLLQTTSHFLQPSKLTRTIVELVWKNI